MWEIVWEWIYIWYYYDSFQLALFFVFRFQILEVEIDLAV